MDQSHKSYKKINEFLLKEGEDIEVLDSKNVFTDYMYKFEVSLSKSEVIMLVTNKNVYTLKTAKYEKINKISLEKLTRIITITTNSSLFALNFQGSIDLLMESVRRTEFIMFIKATFEQNAHLKKL